MPSRSEIMKDLTEKRGLPKTADPSLGLILIAADVSGSFPPKARF